MKLSQLKSNPNNPRTISDHKLDKLIASIKDFDAMLEARPIIVNKDYVVLGGNMRLLALQKLGYDEIPDTWVKFVEFDSEQELEFIIKDNVGFGDWDWEVLNEEWDIDKLGDWGLEIPDEWFSEEEVEADEDDYEIPDEIKIDVIVGDIIEIGNHKLLCGDSTQTDEWHKLFGNEMADLVVTDPPYNVDYTGGTKESLKIINDKKEDGEFYQFLYDFYTALASYTKKGGAWYVWHADTEGANFRLAMKNAGIMVKQCLIWVKNSMVMGRQDYHWQHEPCLYGWKEGASHSWYADRKQTTILNFDRPSRNAEHPTMKPIPLIAYQIKNSSKNGDIVADGFLGSGTTMIACEQLGRRCYGMELDPKYCQVIIDRMKSYDSTIPIKINGKEYVKL